MRNRRKWAAGVMVVVVLCTTAFIFSNSFKNSEASHAQSDRVVKIVKPIVQPLIDPNAQMTWADFDFLVRKSAHFCEYALLGLECALLATMLLRDHGGRGPMLLALYPVCIAAVDEWIQSFSNRTSMMGDVVLDVVGAVCGMGVLWLAVCLRRRRRVGT